MNLAHILNAEGCGRSLARGYIQLPSSLEHIPKPIAGNVVAAHAHEKPIEQRPQCVVFGQSIAGPDDHEGGQDALLAAAPEHALVKHGEEAVENRAVGVEQLVEEHQRSLWKHSFCVGDQITFTEAAD